MALPLAGLAGGALGALGGGLFGSKQKVPQLQKPEQISQFAGPLGTATSTGFQYQADPALQEATQLANQRLAEAMRTGFIPDAQRMQEFQQAYMGERQPALERQLGQQKQAQAIQSSTAGTTGSSRDILAGALQEQLANELRQQLLNQAIQGREQLAQQDIANQMAQAQFAQGIGQQDIANKLAALGATTGARTGSQTSAINYAQAANEIAKQQAALENQKRASTLQNIFGGFSTGGQLFGGSDFAGALGKGGLAGMFG